MSIKKEVEFYFKRGDQEKIMWNFYGSWLLALEIPMGETQFCGISEKKRQFGISKGKVTDLKIPGRSPTTELPAGLTIKWVWLGPNFYIFHDLLPHCNHSAI